MLKTTVPTPYGSVKNTPEFKVPEAVHKSHQRPVKVIKNTLSAFESDNPARRAARVSETFTGAAGDGAELQTRRLESGKQGRAFNLEEEGEILPHINELPCFNQLPRHVATSLIQNSLCAEYAPGESICYQGNEMTSMYLILKGNVEMWRKDNRATSADADSVMASLEGGPGGGASGGAGPGAGDGGVKKPGAKAIAAATVAAAATSGGAAGGGTGNNKRRFGLNLKAALQAVDGILGRRVDRLGPGGVLGKVRFHPPIHHDSFGQTYHMQVPIYGHSRQMTWITPDLSAGASPHVAARGHQAVLRHLSHGGRARGREPYLTPETIPHSLFSCSY